MATWRIRCATPDLISSNRVVDETYRTVLRLGKLALVKLNHMRENPQQPSGTSLIYQAVKIRRTWGQSAGKARMHFREPSETLRSGLAMKLEIQWIVGFVDGEGCFHVGISRHPEMKLKYQVLPEFTVVQHERDVNVLHALKSHFGCGVVRVNHDERMAYRVRDRKHLWERIVPFFEKHKLKTKKRVDFMKFRRVLLKMERGDHLTQEGLDEIRRIAGQMNRGQSR